MSCDKQKFFLETLPILHRECGWEPYMRDIEKFVYQYLGDNILFLSVLIGRVSKCRGPPSSFEKYIVSRIYELIKKYDNKKKISNGFYEKQYIYNILKKCKNDVEKKYYDGTLFNDY